MDPQLQTYQLRRWWCHGGRAALWILNRKLQLVLVLSERNTLWEATGSVDSTPPAAFGQRVKPDAVPLASTILSNAVILQFCQTPDYLSVYLWRGSNVLLLRPVWWAAPGRRWVSCRSHDRTQECSGPWSEAQAAECSEGKGTRGQDKGPSLKCVYELKQPSQLRDKEMAQDLILHSFSRSMRSKVF